MKKIRLLFTFYRSFAATCLLITCASVIILYLGGMELITAIFWFKVATSILVYFFMNSYRRKELYYFLNLGFSKKALWGLVLTLDLLFFIFLLTITLLLQ